MDALFLSRLQFTITTFIHFLFVPLTIGLAFLIAVMETFYARTKNPIYLRMVKFWGKLFLINFTMGIVTGIILEFQFGTNWARYSTYVGDIFGSLLAIEATGFFFLESTMIGVWIFGWKKLSPKAHAIVMWLIAFATCGSAFWILTANAWMQNPVGYEIRNGRAELTNFAAVIMNPTAIISIFHTIGAAATTGAFFIMGISAWHLLRKTDVELYKFSLKVALAVATVGVLGVTGGGDLLGKNIAHIQPAKLAAMESHWQTQTEAPIYLLVWPDEPNAKNTVEILPIPGLLSFMAHTDVNSEVTGLRDIPKEERPFVAMTMVNFRIMVAIGIAMVLVIITGWIRFGKLDQSPWYLKVLPWFIPLPYIACNTGWIMTEVGRQPWLVYKVMKTADGLSEGVTAAQVTFSLTALTLLLVFLTIVAACLIITHIRKGPEMEMTI
jgi:cytochrome bd ubiquinol oxidase subunit I